MQGDWYKPHYENEAPFEVPESWEWVRLKDLCSFLSRGKSPKYSEERKYPVFAQKCNLFTGGISLENARFLDPETLSKWSEEYKLQDGDVLVNSTGTGTVGRTRLFHSDCLGDYPFVVPDSHVSVVRTFNEVNSIYIHALLSSDYGQTYLEDNLAGSTNQKELYIGVLEDMIIPFPPTMEQNRISKSIEQWYSIIDVLESTKQDLQATIVKAKSKILDLAIHGKLVPQDPNDEPAIELLMRVNSKFTPCDNAHYPFDVPNNWAWAMGLDIFKPMKTAFPIGDTFKYIDIDAIDNKRNVITAAKVINTKQAPSRASRYTEKGCVLFSMVRPYLRNIAMVLENDCIASTGFFVCHGKSCLLPKFCYYLMLSNYVVDGLNNFMKGDNSPSITKGQIETFLFPLPPNNEQLRIVTKIEELFAVLDEIQKSIEA